MNIIKGFLLSKRKVEENSFIWNTFAGLINAFQSVFFLIVISRTNSEYDAGIFSIAYSTACLLLVIGNYGLRSFQVTDVNEKFQFKDYVSSRIITSLLMILCSILYVVYGVICNSYSSYKVIIILLICGYKIVDAVEDVFHGMYQSKGRLDIGAKCMTLRLSVSIIAICICLFITSNMIVAFTAGIIVNVFSFGLCTYYTYASFETKIKKIEIKEGIRLLTQSFGVFIAAFFALYIVNAPKYAIDSLLPQEMQAYYGYISMPVFIIGLLNQFLYQPSLVSLSIDWNKKNTKLFTTRIVRQIIIIVCLTGVVIAGGYFLGIPVLSFLYNTELSKYKMEFIILLVGGGILAISGFLTVIITIIRRQKDLVWGYLLTALIAYFGCPFFVREYGMMGAAIAYVIMVSLLALMFGIILMYRICKRKE